MKIGDICSNIRDKRVFGTLRTLPGKGVNLGLIELKTGTVKRLLPVAVHLESVSKKMRQTFEAIMARVLIAETSDITR